MKPGEPALPLKVMMTFLLLLYIYFYGFTYIFLNSDWLRSLENKQKNRFFEQPILNINLTTLRYIYRVSAWSFGLLKYFVGERNLEPPPHLAAANLNRQVKDVFRVLKFILSMQGNSFSVIDFFISNLLLHGDSQKRNTIRSLKIVLELSKTM